MLGALVGTMLPTMLLSGFIFPLESMPGPLQAHFGSAAERWKMYKAAGAVGTVTIANPKSMDIPWARSTLARRR